MGAPAPQIPANNAYRVHFRSPVTATQAGAFLRELKIVAGIFDACDESFLDATACIVRAEDLAKLRKQPDRNSLLLCQGCGIPDPVLGERIPWPDLWVVESPGGGDESALAAEWITAGAGAVAVFGHESACWESHNGAFGRSRGRFPLPGVQGGLDSITAGLLHSLMEELLGETLFDKTGKALDRECLEMRPLRLGRAVQSGLAAMGGEGLSAVRDQLREWRGPVPQSWGGRTR